MIKRQNNSRVSFSQSFIAKMKGMAFRKMFSDTMEDTIEKGEPTELVEEGLVVEPVSSNSVEVKNPETGESALVTADDEGNIAVTPSEDVVQLEPVEPVKEEPVTVTNSYAIIRKKNGKRAVCCKMSDLESGDTVLKKDFPDLDSAYQDLVKNSDKYDDPSVDPARETNSDIPYQVLKDNKTGKLQVERADFMDDPENRELFEVVFQGTMKECDEYQKRQKNSEEEVLPVEPKPEEKPVEVPSIPAEDAEIPEEVREKNSSYIQKAYRQK